jgi:hypothetical protein
VGLPRLDHLAGAGGNAWPLAAEAADDVHGEGDPQLVVVAELGVAAERRAGSGAGGGVPGRVERQAVARAEPDEAVGTELRPGPRDGEVDVEEDGGGSQLTGQR